MPALAVVVLAACVATALVTTACTDRQPDARDTIAAAPAVVAAHDSQVAWTVRPILTAPRYFVLSEWVDDATLWGLAGENPVDIDARTGTGSAWAVRASGARRSPDRSTLAWGD